MKNQSSNFKNEIKNLIAAHKEELELNGRLFGGVFISENSMGKVTVCGADQIDLKEIFQTAFVSSDSSDLLDARVQLQDLLEEAGIPVIAKFDFENAMHGQEA